jgi:hypothetical protein
MVTLMVVDKEEYGKMVYFLLVNLLVQLFSALGGTLLEVLHLENRQI